MGPSLINSVRIFAKGTTLSSLFSKWYKIWKIHGEEYEELELPLQALGAAVMALKEKNDKPLLALPKEVRDLVMPLLEKEFSK